MKLIYIITTSIVAISVFGCQSDQRMQDQRIETVLNAHFYLRYLQTEKLLKAEVSFNTPTKENKSTPVQVNNMNLQGQEMQERHFSVPRPNIRYDLNTRGDYEVNYEFEFEHEVLGKINKTLRLDPIKNINIPNELIQKSKGVRIEWTGQPLDQTQSLVLLFTNADNQAASIEIAGPTESTLIELSTSQTQTLHSGANELMVVQKQLLSEEKNSLHTISEMEFYTDPIKVTVED